MARTPRTRGLDPEQPREVTQKWIRGRGNRPPGDIDTIGALRRKQRRVRAFEMKVRGHSYPQIARELGVSVKQSRTDVARQCKELGTEGAEEKRRIYSAQLQDKILDCNRAIDALRPLAIPECRQSEEERRLPPDVEASRAMAGHIRTLRQLVSELGVINGVRVERVEHGGQVEHVHAVGGEDLLSRLARIASENERAGAGAEGAEREGEDPVRPVTH